jgi:tRNA pseudouridine32 synthase/23S rRNA pseudouridine746 synthase
MNFVKAFENTSFVAVDKPFGVLSVLGRLGRADPRPCLAVELEKAYGKIWPVHRLDLEVSGLVLFAKSAEAHRASSGWFEHHQIQKTYEAWTEIVEPLPTSEWQEWRSKLVRGKKRSFEAEHGKESLTLARFIETRSSSVSENKVMRWELQPKTGRSHQLRYELAKHGFPIVGDVLYRSKQKFIEENAIALRSIVLDFSHTPDVRQFDLPSEIRVKGL